MPCAAPCGRGAGSWPWPAPRSSIRARRGVETDTLRAQDAMRALVPGLGLALMIGPPLHAVATGNLLPASVGVICVDINPAAVTKLSDRGTRQGIGVVSDAASFLRELCE